MSYERPILFSGPMVRAILSGRKTQTRRVCKSIIWTGGKPFPPNTPHHYGEIASIKQCPYGKTGDLLWVRETFASNEQAGIHPAEAQWVYRATDETWGEEYEAWKWKPSIFMPRAACRIILQVTDIRVERLQDISEDDAKAEGATPINIAGEPCAPGVNPQAYREGFCHLWQSINGFDSWENNPLVWVVEFKPIKS